MATLSPAFLEAEFCGGKKRWATNLPEPPRFFVPLFYIPDTAGAAGTKINWVYRVGAHGRVQEINAKTITRQDD